MSEVGEAVELPAELAELWATRDYYGTVSHNARAVYNFYLGFFSGNPAELNPLPPTAAAPRYVELMGGADAVVRAARRAYDIGDYRWAAQLLQHVVYSDADHTEARLLQADSFEQLGYQTEAGTWRNFYHVGAKELREGAPDIDMGGPDPTALSPDLPMDAVFDYLGIVIDSDRAAGMAITVNLDATDTGERYCMMLNRQVVTARRRLAPEPDATLGGKHVDLVSFLLGNEQDRLLASGAVRVDGDTEKVMALLDLRTRFALWFPIVTRPAAV